MLANEKLLFKKKMNHALAELNFKICLFMWLIVLCYCYHLYWGKIWGTDCNLPIS